MTCQPPQSYHFLHMDLHQVCLCEPGPGSRSQDGLSTAVPARIQTDPCSTEEILADEPPVLGAPGTVEKTAIRLDEDARVTGRDWKQMINELMTSELIKLRGFCSRLRCVLKQLQRGNMSLVDLKKNLDHAASVLEHLSSENQTRSDWRYQTLKLYILESYLKSN